MRQNVQRKFANDICKLILKRVREQTIRMDQLVKRVNTQRGNDALQDCNSFCYVNNGKGAVTSRWRCAQRTCPATLTTRNSTMSWLMPIFQSTTTPIGSWRLQHKRLKRLFLTTLLLFRTPHHQLFSKKSLQTCCPATFQVSLIIVDVMNTFHTQNNAMCVTEKLILFNKD